ncbi:hypothetical protein GCM10020254_48320 [Streptomyces goshikiensis]
MPGGCGEDSDISPGSSRQSHSSMAPLVAAPGQERAETPRVGGPDTDGPARGRDADVGFLIEVEQGRHVDAEGVGELDHGLQAGVRAGLFDLYDHAATEPGPGGQAVEGEPPDGSASA